jgi:hypothetical protein
MSKEILRPIHEILEDAIISAQDDQAYLTDKEEKELRKLLRILEEANIDTIRDLVKLLR